MSGAKSGSESRGVASWKGRWRSRKGPGQGLGVHWGTKASAAGKTSPFAAFWAEPKQRWQQGVATGLLTFQENMEPPVARTATSDTHQNPSVLRV